jgi:hypothetical protein
MTISKFRLLTFAFALFLVSAALRADDTITCTGYCTDIWVGTVQCPSYTHCGVVCWAPGVGYTGCF